MKNALAYIFSQKRTKIYCASLFMVLPLWSFVISSQDKAMAGTVMESPIVSNTQSIPATTDYGLWGKEGSEPASHDALWQKGTSVQDLLRKKNPHTAQTAKEQENPMGPKPSPSKEKQEKSGVTLAGGAIQGDSEVVGSSWHSPDAQEPIIDEDMLHDKRDVLGAYGQMVDENGFEMTMGPELHIPGEGASVLGKDGADNSELGMSMKFKWGF